MYTFLWPCLNGHSCVIKTTTLTAKSRSSSDFGDNYKYII